MSHKTIKPHTRLEHIEVHTSDGHVRMLVKQYSDASNISGSAYGVDWWREAETPKRSCLRWVLDFLQRTE